MCKGVAYCCYVTLCDLGYLLIINGREKITFFLSLPRSRLSTIKQITPGTNVKMEALKTVKVKCTNWLLKSHVCENRGSKLMFIIEYLQFQKSFHHCDKQICYIVLRPVPKNFLLGSPCSSGAFVFNVFFNAAISWSWHTSSCSLYNNSSDQR